MSTNPAVSMPDAEKVAQAIRNVPFVAVSDIMAGTDTGDLADVLLPAAGWGEKDGTVTNSERRISRQRAFLSAPAQTRPDWRIISDVATRMGFGAAFAYDTPADIFAEYIALDAAARSFARDLDLSIFADVDYATLVPTQWPRNDARFFADGKFYHADGKARMLAVQAPTPLKAVPSLNTLTLNTGRNRDQWHTMTRTGKAPRLGAHLAEPYLELHPDDAAKAGVVHGDLVKLQNALGRTILRALVTQRVARGQPFAPMHWTRQTACGGTVNSVIASLTDPVSGQPALKRGSVSVSLFKAGWYGFLACAPRPVADTSYAAISRTTTGWQVEMAALETPEDWVQLLRDITQLSDATASVLDDGIQGTIRVALYEQDILQAVFFAAPQPVVLSRSAAIAHVGTSTPPLAALAGRMGQDQPDPGPVVCACFNVGQNTLLAAVDAGAGSVKALGAVTCAGTNCGSCKPELARLVAQTALPVAAE